MTYLLDTNTCIGVLTNRIPTLVERWKRTSPSQIRLCSIVKAELLYGAEKSSKRELVQQKLGLFFSRFKSMPFNDRAAQSYGVIRAALETAGQSIGSNDTLIAAIGLANGLAVVTHNTSEFSEYRACSSRTGRHDRPLLAAHFTAPVCRLILNQGTTVTPNDVRSQLIEALRLDLIGPRTAHPPHAHYAEEVLPIAPSKWYLTGFLVPYEAPASQRADDDGDDTLDELGRKIEADDDNAPEAASARKAFFPSSMGLSVLVR